MSTIYETEKSQRMQEGKFIRIWPKTSLGYIDIDRAKVRQLIDIMELNYPYGEMLAQSQSLLSGNAPSEVASPVPGISPPTPESQ